MLQFSLYEVFPDDSFVSASFDDEPEPRASLLSVLLIDLYGQEDHYLAEIAKAEAGETVLDLYNQEVDVQLYPDGRVIIEELRYNEEDRAERGPPDRAEFTLAEIKQLILDWLVARREWRAQKEAARAARDAQLILEASAPGTASAIAKDFKAVGTARCGSTGRPDN